MKIKQIAAAAAFAALVSTPAFADTSNFEGLSASIGLALNGSNTKLSAEDTSIDLGKTSQVGVVDLNYGMAMSNGFVLGAGLALDLGKAKLGGVELGNETLSLETKNHYSIYLQPTWILNKTTGIYAKVGYNHTKGTASGNVGSDSAKFKGTSYGLGVKTFIDSNLFIQVEASMANFKSKTFEDGDGAFSIKPKMTRATVSLGYRF
jgi:opacity protein-like surface antigen